MNNSSLMGMFEVVTGSGWRLGLAGTVMVTCEAWVEEVGFPAWVPFEINPPSSVSRPTTALRLVNISGTVMQGVKNSKSILD